MVFWEVVFLHLLWGSLILNNENNNNNNNNEKKKENLEDTFLKLISLCWIIDVYV